MDASATLREHLGTELTLVQGRLRVDGVVTGLAVHVGDIEEVVEMQIEATDGSHRLTLAPDDWTTAIHLFPLHRFLPDTPVKIEWQPPAAELPTEPQRRTRPSSLAE